MVGLDIDGYTARFHELARLVPDMVTPKSQRVNHYIRGLALEIKANVTSSKPDTIQGAVSMANHLTTDDIKDGIFKKKEIVGDKKRSNNQFKNRGRNDRNKRQMTGRNFVVTAPVGLLTWFESMESVHHINIDGYTARFHELARLVPDMVTPKSQRVNHYIRGLALEIKANVTSSKPDTIQGAVSMANHLTTDDIKDGIFKKKDIVGDKKRSNNQFKNRGRNDRNKRQMTGQRHVQR
ncbi:hypothetical protein Tco_0001245 [Tanacetum coccineum]